MIRWEFGLSPKLVCFAGCSTTTRLFDACRATEGSLVVREEQGMSDMKPTAASLREAARS